MTDTPTGEPVDGAPEDARPGRRRRDQHRVRQRRGGGGPGAVRGHLRRGGVRRMPGARHPAPVRSPASADAGAPHPDTALAAERLGDLQRLQAEYVNYKRRVDRDRALVQERAVRDVLESVLPVLDDIQAARDHGDLVEGPFAAIADKLESTLGKYGLVRFGAKGEAFDPMQHEALMHAPWPAATTSCRPTRRPRPSSPCSSPATVPVSRCCGRLASRSPTPSDPPAPPSSTEAPRGGADGQPGLVREGLLRDPRRPPGRRPGRDQEGLPQARAQAPPRPERRGHRGREALQGHR